LKVKKKLPGKGYSRKREGQSQGMKLKNCMELVRTTNNTGPLEQKVREMMMEESRTINKSETVESFCLNHGVHSDSNREPSMDCEPRKES
jgi:hypothetical protein